MIVLKFGGSSVKDADRIDTVKSIIQNYNKEHKRIAVVVSALGGITDQLIATGELASKKDDKYIENFNEIYNRHLDIITKLVARDKQEELITFLKATAENLQSLLKGVSLIREMSARTKDCICSFGEIMSSKIIATFLEEDIKKTRHLDAREIITTNSNFGNARLDLEATHQNCVKHIRNNGVYIMGGFIASNALNETTTLGRGGSDFSASILAACTDAKELHIWTDVDGVMSADPRKATKAFSIPYLSYDEAMELSHFGAKVIYPPTIKPVLQKNIPIRIKNTFNPAFEGTLISNEPPLKETNPVKGISSISSISLVTLQGAGMIGVAGIAGRLFSVLAKNNISVILISQASSEHSICFAINPDMDELAKTVIESEFERELERGDIEPVLVESKRSILAIVGENMNSTSGISGRLFQSLGKNGININAIAQGSSELNISTVVDAEDEIKAINVLHDALFLSENKTLNIFIVGTGLIGGTLVKQIQEQSKNLLNNLKLDLKVIGITNTRKMHIDVDGINLTNVDEILRAKGSTADFNQFVQSMIGLNLPNSIFVDNTASELPIDSYLDIVNNSISIVTPNKIAKTQDTKSHFELLEAAKKSGAQFMYETNVGAGLPVISTLRDLIQSGDEIQKIEAVLSGSLSFIFNSFSTDTNFNEIVELAKEKGYTEPDPRVDLSGKDVARKVLILARETGQSIELNEIRITNILPDACLNASSVETFFKELKNENKHFTQMLENAQRENKKLRFIATITKEDAFVELQAVDAENPFYHLSGSDNMVVYTTKRYHDRPLVVKGPGAGAEVTAGGVFAEIINIGKYLA